MLRSYFVCVLLGSILMLSGCGSKQAPSTPTGVAATAAATITLSWNASSGASSYVVYRGTQAGIINKTLLASGISSTTYTDSSAILGTTYYYQVTALNSDGQSSPSDEVTATITNFTLTASQSSTTQNILIWPLVSNASSYTVYRYTVSTPYDSSNTPLASGITTNGYYDAAAISGTTYYYRVVALDSNSNALSVSTEASVTTE